MQIFGFSLLRNGIKYDYLFHESLTSLSGICEKIYLALGKSEDGTEDAIQQYPFLEIIPTVWKENLRKKGLVLSIETNKALSILRQEHENTPQSWGIYLQADEVINEEDYERIITDITYAENNGYDAVRFRYWHFWQSHNQVAINSHWYPQEIRAIKLKSNIVSCGDAMGFSNVQKVYDSDAYIYHYGHAREAKAYQKKSKDFHRWWHPDEKLETVYQQEKEKTGGRKLRTLAYYGTHPQIMQQRIKKMDDVYQQSQADFIHIVANKSWFASGFIERINVKSISWSRNIMNLNKFDKNQVIIFKPNWLEKIFYPSQVPQKPYRQKARKWTKETILTLQLSEKGIGIKKPQSKQCQ